MNNYIIVIIVVIIIIIFIKNSNNNILLKKKEKQISPYCPEVTLVGTGPGTFEFRTYLFNYLTRPNDLGYSDYFRIPECTRIPVF